jgi:hypothetical protein
VEAGKSRLALEAASEAALDGRFTSSGLAPISTRARSPAAIATSLV